MTYDALGNRLTLTDETLGGTTSYSYEPAHNKLASVTDDRNETTSFAYDGAGNLLSTALPSGRTMTSTYLPDGRLDTSTDLLGTVTQFVYDLDGNLAQIQRGSGPDQHVGNDPVNNRDSTGLQTIPDTFSECMVQCNQDLKAANTLSMCQTAWGLGYGSPQTAAAGAMAIVSREAGCAIRCAGAKLEDIPRAIEQSCCNDNAGLGVEYASLQCSYGTDATLCLVFTQQIQHRSMGIAWLKCRGSTCTGN